MTPKEVLDMAKENGAKMVDLRFMDFPGLWQHFSVPIGELEESSFEDGFGFDGSSIRGWQPIHASDIRTLYSCVASMFFRVAQNRLHMFHLLQVNNILDQIGFLLQS